MNARLIDSTTFQFCLLVITVSALAAGFTEDLTWKDWLETAVSLVLVYAGKEGVKYSAKAYEGKPNA